MDPSRTIRLLQCHIAGINEKFWKRALDSRREPYTHYKQNDNTLYVVFDNINIHYEFMGLDRNKVLKYEETEDEDVDNFHNDELLEEDFKDSSILEYSTLPNPNTVVVKTASFRSNPCCKLTAAETATFEEGSEMNRTGVVRLVMKSAKILVRNLTIQCKNSEQLVKLKKSCKHKYQYDPKKSIFTFTSKEDAFIAHITR